MTSRLPILAALLLCWGNEYVNGGKVLILHPMSAASHVLSLRSLAQNLVKRGHEVKVIRWLDQHEYPDISAKGLTEVLLAVNNSDGSIPMYSHNERSRFQMPMNVMWSKGTDASALPIEGFLAVSAFCQSLLKRQELFESLRSESYDMAVVDLLYNECSLAVAHHLGLPAVGYWALTFAGGEAQYTTAVNPPSTVPVVMSHNTDVMTFPQRLYNHFISLCSHLVMQLQFLITGYHIRQYLPECPWPDTLLGNLSGVLINSHPAVDYPRLLPPSFIEVGGLQIRDNTRELPKDLADFIASSGEHGIVLFTLGFTFDLNFVPEEVVQNYMRAFSRLKQKVLVKAEGTAKHIPDNVKVVRWLPQQDILGHNKTRVFVTHCGMHGVMEALHHGIPMVGVPIFADQQDVLVRLEQREVALGIHKHSEENTIFNAIDEVLNNPKYLENAQILSRIIRGDLHKPLERATSLIELVMETKGAEHLKLSSRHLSVFQYHGIDILAAVLFILFILAFIVYYMTLFMIKSTGRINPFVNKNKIE